MSERHVTRSFGGGFKHHHDMLQHLVNIAALQTKALCTRQAFVRRLRETNKLEHVTPTSAIASLGPTALSKVDYTIR
jgi:hypothetical protein